MSLNFEPSDDDDDFSYLGRRDGTYQPPAAQPPKLPTPPPEKLKPKKKQDKAQSQHRPLHPATKVSQHPSAHSLAQPLIPFVHAGFESAPPKPRRRRRRSRQTIAARTPARTLVCRHCPINSVVALSPSLSLIQRESCRPLPLAEISLTHLHTHPLPNYMYSLTHPYSPSHLHTSCILVAHTLNHSVSHPLTHTHSYSPTLTHHNSPQLNHPATVCAFSCLWVPLQGWLPPVWCVFV